MNAATVRVSVEIPAWVHESLCEVTAIDRPGTSTEAILVEAIVAGLGAINGVGHWRDMEAKAAKAPALTPDTDPWEVRMYRALRAATVAAGGSLTVDGAEAMRLAPEATSGQTRRAVGYVIGYRARDYGTVTTRDGVLLIVPMGRPAGSALHQYALTATG